MITDREANCVWVADLLATRHPELFVGLQRILDKHGIPLRQLPHTKDIWAVDYMPIQISDDSFLQFRYQPSYLTKYKKYQLTISNVELICETIGIQPKKSDILLDGGNLIRTKHTAVITERVFAENPLRSATDLKTELQELLQVERVIIIPEQPHDFTGHADGMLRFINEQTVLVNDYTQESRAFQRAFREALEDAELQTEVLPYAVYSNRSSEDATGTYINYLEVQNLIVLPIFGLGSDAAAEAQMRKLFPQHQIETLRCNDIARLGGVLNCVTWKVKV